MILADLNRLETLNFLRTVPALRQVLDWLQRRPANPADGITELQGQDLYINVQGYATKPREQCNWESHRHTADLQFCISGGESIDWTPVSSKLPSVSYDAARDFECWPPQIEIGNTLQLTPGSFVIFLPGELHRPVIADGLNKSIRKAVAKIHANLLPIT